MDSNVPYMPSSGNLHRIFDKMQNAGVPEVFSLDFLTDLGFTSSNDRPVIKLLKYIGFLDQSGRPQSSYREFMDQTRAKSILASRLRVAYDDLFRSDRDANTRTTTALKGWFKTKTGESEAVADKIATTFKALAAYADFSKAPDAQQNPVQPQANQSEGDPITSPTITTSSSQAANGNSRPMPPINPPASLSHQQRLNVADLGFVYRLEIHLRDTQNVETFRAIFRALREEMMG